MGSFTFTLIGLALSLSGVAGAQDTRRPPPAETPDVVVKGRVDPSEPDPTNARPSVIVGSRLARPSTQNNPYLAMRTSAGGFSPDAGMDAFKGDLRLTWKTCKADGATLSKPVACSLAAVQAALAKGDHARARTLALGVAARPELTIEERYVTQNYLYRIADAAPDPGARRAALAAMVDTGLMPAPGEAAAVRALAAMARRSGDRGEALARYEQASLLDSDDTQSRINAAALLQAAGDPARARAHVRAAIAIAGRTGQAIPEEWTANAR